MRVLSAVCQHINTSKKSHHFIITITLSAANQLSQFLAHILFSKFANRGYTVSPPNTVCVTTLPCKILIMTLFMFTCIRWPFYCCNNCQFFYQKIIKIIFERIIPDDYYLFTSNWQVKLWLEDYCYRNIRRFDINVCFKQFVITVDSYAATYPL